MIHLMITDDHDMVRDAIQQFLQTQPNIQVVAEAGSGVEMLEKLQSVKVDLLMMDLQMPGICGTELVQCVKSLYPELPILVLSAYNSPTTVADVLKAGASGFVSKNCLPSVLIEALNKIAILGHYLEPAIARQLSFIDATQENAAISLIQQHPESSRLPDSPGKNSSKVRMTGLAII